MKQQQCGSPALKIYLICLLIVSCCRSMSTALTCEAKNKVIGVYSISWLVPNPVSHRPGRACNSREGLKVVDIDPVVPQVQKHRVCASIWVLRSLRGSKSTSENLSL